MGLDEKIPFGVVLKPTPKEFQDFKAYIYSVVRNPKYQNAGCVKVI